MSPYITFYVDTWNNYICIEKVEATGLDQLQWPHVI